jgi:hypothetical protein
LMFISAGFFVFWFVDLVRQVREYHRSFAD